MDDLKKLAEDYLAAARHVGGCGDSGCVVIRPTGQHTNGGCRCMLNNTDPVRARGVSKLLMMAQHLAKEVTHD